MEVEGEPTGMHNMPRLNKSKLTYFFMRMQSAMLLIHQICSKRCPAKHQGGCPDDNQRILQSFAPPKKVAGKLPKYSYRGEKIRFRAHAYWTTSK